MNSVGESQKNKGYRTVGEEVYYFSSTMDWIFASLPNPYVEVLTSSVAIFADGVFKEVIKVKCSHKCGAFIQQLVSVLVKRDDTVCSPSLCQGTKERPSENIARRQLYISHE